MFEIYCIYINPNPTFPSFIANVSLSLNISLLGYSGKSNWLVHACAVGNLSKFVSNTFAILNLFISPIQKI